MASTLSRIKQDFTRNRTKSAVLAVLSMAVAVMIFRTFFSNSPRVATAMNAPAPDPALLSDDPVLSQAQMEQRIEDSKLLWATLREKRGVTASNAFLFDSGFYTRDPARMASEAPAHIIDDSGEKPVPKTSDEQKVAGKIASIREEAQAMTLQSTVMAADPLAVINGEIFRVGQQTHGFHIAMIKPKQVTLEKNGTTLTLEMAK